MTVTGADEQAEDGRRLRRQRGRTRVVDAVLDLILEDGTAPDVEVIASRAGVSVATVYRYFEGLDDLRVAVVARTRERYAELFEPPAAGAAPRADRVASLVRVRADRYETIGPVARLVRSRVAERPELAEVLLATRREQVDQARALFAPELDGLAPAGADDVVVSVVAATSFEAWDVHIGLGRTPRQVRRAWTLAVDRLVAPNAGIRGISGISGSAG